jgi:copper chaperone NosL
VKRYITIVVSSVLLIAGMALAAQKQPAPPSPKDKCPVCGMFVAKYPDWTTSIVYQDGKTFYFDGPKDLFTYYLNPAKYDPARKRADIAALYVKDYYSLAFIDGRQAFYVIGSNVLGPMGRELVPFVKRADADGFLHDHLGKNVLRFGEITMATLKALE